MILSQAQKFYTQCKWIVMPFVTRVVYVCAVTPYDNDDI